MPITNPPGQPVYGSAEHARLIAYGRHSGVQTAMAWLAFTHLPENLQSLSRIIYDAAVALVQRIPNDSAELTTALNTLVGAKDWFMRAGIRSDQGQPGPVPRPATVVDPPSRFETAREILTQVGDDPARVRTDTWSPGSETRALDPDLPDPPEVVTDRGGMGPDYVNWAAAERDARARREARAFGRPEAGTDLKGPAYGRPIHKYDDEEA